jgi:hypothetical protein
MAGRLLVDADLHFSLHPPDGGEPVEGHLSGEGTRLRLEVSNPQGLADVRGRRWVAGIADQLARDGLRVSVVTGGEELLVLGSPRNSWWQRRLTGSRHIKIRRFGRFASLARPRRGGGSAVFPRGDLVPPPTPVPLAPTFLRRRRADVTTTHDPEGGGRPRLVAPPGHWPWDTSAVFHLRHGTTTVGSDPASHIRVDGLDRFHAEIRRNADDEYVFVQLSRTNPIRVNGERVRERILRTGTRLELADWTLVYARDEYADHGRPYGGRVGGEVGHQRPQPPLHGYPNPAGFDEPVARPR